MSLTIAGCASKETITGTALAAFIAFTMPIDLLSLFFQAEDGILYYRVTGVQTCALPIYRKSTLLNSRRRHRDYRVTGVQTCALPQIGRASGRERVYISAPAVSLKKT